MFRRGFVVANDVLFDPFSDQAAGFADRRLRVVNSIKCCTGLKC